MGETWWNPSGAGPTGAPSCGPCSTRWPGWDIAPTAPRNDGSDRSRVDLVAFPRAPGGFHGIWMWGDGQNGPKSWQIMGLSWFISQKSWQIIGLSAKNHGKSLVYHGLSAKNHGKSLVYHGLSAKNHGKSLVYHGLSMSFGQIWSNRI